MHVRRVAAPHRVPGGDADVRRADVSRGAQERGVAPVAVRARDRLGGPAVERERGGRGGGEHGEQERARRAAARPRRRGRRRRPRGGRAAQAAGARPEHVRPALLTPIPA